MSKETFGSIRDFLKRIAARDFDGDLQSEIKKLTPEQLKELAHELLQQNTDAQE
jgi:hypothetical protein